MNLDEQEDEKKPKRNIIWCNPPEACHKKQILEKLFSNYWKSISLNLVPFLKYLVRILSNLVIAEQEMS